MFRLYQINFWTGPLIGPIQSEECSRKWIQFFFHFFFQSQQAFLAKKDHNFHSQANWSHPVPTCSHCTIPRCAGLVMFVHSSAMTQIKADLMGKNIATSCWLNKETLWRLRYLESFPSDYQVPDAFQESIRCGIKAFQLIIITELCSTGRLKCEQNAYPICFSGLSDIRSGMVWTWSRASFQETTEIFTVAHNCHGKFKFAMEN